MGNDRKHGRQLWAMTVIALLVCASVGLLWGAQRSKVSGPKAAPAAPKAAPATPSQPPAAVSPNGVEIAAPASDAKVRGIVSVQAACPASSAYVLFRVDDKFIYATASPYKVRWDTSTMEDGPHVLSVDSFDAKGKFEGSSSVRITVKNAIDAPSGGLLLSVRFGAEDMLQRSISAHGELASPGPGETAPPGCESLSGNLSAVLSQTVMDPFYQGTSILLRNRLKDGSITSRANVRTALAEIGQYAMVQVSRNGLTLPQLTSLRTTRIAPGELSLALPDYPVLVGDTWQSPIAVMPVLNAKKAVYVQAQHTFEGLRWYSNRECAVITSTYTLPRIGVTGPAFALASRPSFEISLTQMGGAGEGMDPEMRARMRARMGGTRAAAATSRGIRERPRWLRAECPAGWSTRRERGPPIWCAAPAAFSTPKTKSTAAWSLQRPGRRLRSTGSPSPKWVAARGAWACRLGHVCAAAPAAPAAPAAGTLPAPPRRLTACTTPPVSTTALRSQATW